MKGGSTGDCQQWGRSQEPLPQGTISLEPDFPTITSPVPAHPVVAKPIVRTGPVTRSQARLHPQLAPNTPEPAGPSLGELTGREARAAEFQAQKRGVQVAEALVSAGVPWRQVYPMMRPAEPAKRRGSPEPTRGGTRQPGEGPRAFPYQRAAQAAMPLSVMQSHQRSRRDWWTHSQHLRGAEMR